MHLKHDLAPIIRIVNLIMTHPIIKVQSTGTP